MQTQYWSAFLVVAAIACSEDRPRNPDAGPPGDVGEACRLDVDAAALTGAWDPRFSIAGFTGPDGHAPTVYDFARDADGSIVAAGEFRYLGRDRVEPLLRLRNGRWEPARTTWELAPPGAGFSSVAIAPDGKLALATYDDFGPRSGQIWLDEGTGLKVIGTFDGLIRRLRWYRGQLWAAGWDQIHQGATTIQGLAVWNGTAWAAPPGGAPDSFAFELVEDGADLLVGGDFTRIGGVAARGVAAFDGRAWRAMSFRTGVSVYALSRGPDRALYAGGAFGDLGDGAGGLARWTGTAWTLAGGGVVNQMFPGVVTDLVEHGGALDVAGCFVTVGGGPETPKAVTSRDVARFDGAAWQTLDDDTQGAIAPWLEPRSCGDEGPSSVWDVSKQALFSAGDRLLLGGSFPGIAGVQSQAVIGHDGTAWRPEGSPGLGIGGSIDRVGIAAASCDVWGAGQLSHVAGAPTRARVVHFTGEGWTPIADAIPLDANCPGFAVAPGGDVALGCTEFPAEGDAVGRVYRVRGDRLVQVGADQPPIQAIAYGPTGALWIGGGAATGFVARLDGEAFTMIEAGFDAPVSQLDVIAASDVLAGGSFTAVGATAAARIARWNGTAWSALGAGLPGTATALAHAGTTIYASTLDEGTGQLLLGAYDGATWRELAAAKSGLTPMPFYNFNAIQPITGGVIAVGTAVLDDGVGRGALVYRDGTFTALGGGVHAIGLAGLAVSRDAIWVGGLIAEAGSGASATPTVGIARYVLGR